MNRNLYMNAFVVVLGRAPSGLEEILLLASATKFVDAMKL